MFITLQEIALFPAFFPGVIRKRREKYNLGDTMKKMKKIVLDSSPSYVFDEEAKNRFKNLNLIQDFSELEETEEMKKRLQKAKRKQLRLLAVVRFLRRRYKYLLKNPAQKTPSERLVQPKLPNIRNQSSLKERNFREKEASIKRTPAIDLNQISVETEQHIPCHGSMSWLFLLWEFGLD